MIKYSKLLIGTGLLCIGLAGCGTSNDAGKKPEKKAEQTSAQPSGKTEQASGSAGSQSDGKTADNSSAEQSGVRVMEQNLTFQLNGASKTETAFLKKSDNQSYSLYILPEFELTSEEPGKDNIFLKSDDSVFMRVEILSDSADLTTEEEMIKAQLGAVSKDISTPTLGKLPFKNAAAFEAANNTDVVTSILVKDDKTPFKVTMFTKKGADYRSAFIQMANTVLVSPEKK